MANSKVVIDIIAPNSRTFNMLEFVLQQHGKGRFELGRGNRPDLVIVDFDKSDVKTVFRKYRSRFPEIPAMLLLNLPEEYESLHVEDRIGAEYLLLKPFAAKDFISKISECLGGISVPSDQINSARFASPDGKEATLTGVKSVLHGRDPSSKKLSPEPSRNIADGSEKTIPQQFSSSSNQATRLGSRQRTWPALESEDIAYSFALESDINMADDAAVRNIWLKTDNKLLGYLKSAISQQLSARSAICLSIRDSLSIFISPYAKTVAVVGKDTNLSDLARQDFSGGQISVSESAMPGKNFQLQLELEAFLWRLALYTYRGCLPEGIDVNKPVYLKYWPNLTRLEPTPNAMRIASLLCRQPVALAFIVRILNIPQKHVFNFFAAANAIGFAGPAVREVDNMLLPSYPDELGALPVQGYTGESCLSEQERMMIKDYPAILPLGTQVHEYVIEDVLGTGSFGITYKATDTHLGNSVVIKEYIPESFARRGSNNCVSARSDDTMEIFSWGRERFLEEAKILAKFHHPNIVRVNRYFMANDTAYFVMDFEEGETLQSILSRTDKPLGENMIINIFTQILNGLSVVHQQNYLHRDIKPGNIYIRKDNTAILIDFGAARLEMPGDGSTTVVVTAGYAPVELYAPDSKKGPWTDVYSIGATIYRCLTKEAPPVSIERQKKLEDFGVDPCPSLLKDMPQLGGRVLLDSVDWMMSIAAEERPQTVQDVLDVWAGKTRRSGSPKPSAIEPKKSKTQYKILIAGSAGTGIPTALQGIRDPEISSAEAIAKPSGQINKTQTLSLDFASLDISSHERILLYGVPEQQQLNVVRDMLQKGALGLVLLIDNARKNPFDDLDCFLNLFEGFIENTGLVIGINRTEQYPGPTLHDYHSHLAKTQRNWKAPPPIMEVAPGNRQEVRQLLLSLLFHLNPSL